MPLWQQSPEGKRQPLESFPLGTFYPFLIPERKKEKSSQMSIVNTFGSRSVRRQAVLLSEAPVLSTRTKLLSVSISVFMFLCFPGGTPNIWDFAATANG